jgi:hypothetical protein
MRLLPETFEARAVCNKALPLIYVCKHRNCLPLAPAAEEAWQGKLCYSEHTKMTGRNVFMRTLRNTNTNINKYELKVKLRLIRICVSPKF